MAFMTIDEAITLINEAPKGKAIEVAHEVIAKLSEEDAAEMGGDLEEMAIVEDYS